MTNLQIYDPTLGGCPFALVSFFTPKYAKVFNENLAQSLAPTSPHYRLHTILFEGKEQGNWQLNCMLKPEAMLTARRITDKPLLWVDADAVIPDHGRLIKAFSGLLDSGPFDMACYAPAIAKHEHHDPRAMSNLLSGTLVFRNTFAANELLLAWSTRAQDAARERRDDTNSWDQELLWQALAPRIKANTIQVANLSPAWVRICDFFPAVTDPLIIHNQASRTHK